MRRMWRMRRMMWRIDEEERQGDELDEEAKQDEKKNRIERDMEDTEEDYYQDKADNRIRGIKRMRKLKRMTSMRWMTRMVGTKRMMGMKSISSTMRAMRTMRRVRRMNRISISILNEKVKGVGRMSRMKSTRKMGMISRTRIQGGLGKNEKGE